MSKKLVQTQRFLIIAILFLICVILFLLILIKYQDSQLHSSFSSHENKEQEFEHLNIFTRNLYEQEFLQEYEHKNSTLEEKYEDQDSVVEETFKANLDKKSMEFTHETSKQEGLKHIQDQRAKLAIIIDDMANASQVRALKALNLKLNPSFFPPDKNHINTPELALKFDFYMVHLPLAAINYKKTELDTLEPHDSKERILEKIKQIKRDFKDLKFINNHTGSLFTSNEEAMIKLYRAFEEEGLIFVDSKTVANSKAPKVAKALGHTYIQRDIFLDNEDDVPYIKKQLASAVKLAQRKGFAIAIGHPRKNTFKALEQSKDLLENVELVYLSEFYAK